MLLPLVVIAAAGGGAIWAGIAGFFKAYFNVNEILSTIMLNLVAVQMMNYLLSGPLVNKSQSFAITGLIPQTKLLSKNAWLPTIVSGTQLNLGVVIAVAVAVAVYFLLWRTGFGFRIRAVGLSRDAAAYAGMPVKRTIMNAMALSGACCGIAGAMLVFGSISHRMVTDGSLTGFTGNDGFNGIVVGLFGGLNPLWSILSAYLFGGLSSAAPPCRGHRGADRPRHHHRGAGRHLRGFDRLPAGPLRIQEEAQRLDRARRAPRGTGRTLVFKLMRARA